MKTAEVPRIRPTNNRPSVNPTRKFPSDRTQHTVCCLSNSSMKDDNELQYPRKEFAEPETTSSSLDLPFQESLPSSYGLIRSPSSPLDTTYTAVSDSHFYYIHKLYLQEWKNGPPSVLDPVRTSGFARWQICEEISNSGIFEKYGLKPVDPNEVYPDFSEDQSNPPDDANSPYTKRSFTVYEFYPDDPKKEPYPRRLQEYVFTCLLRDELSGTLVPYYVSKPYVLPGFRAHRYVFLREDEHSSLKIMLAESSGDVYEKPSFNVELYYLQRRREQKEVPNIFHQQDAVTKLHSDNREDSQLDRLCTIVLTSPQFRDKKKIVYPRPLRHQGWTTERITFRTKRGKKRAAGKNFAEHMLRCSVTMADGYERMFCISQAYKPNEVFVYSVNPTKNEFYLETLVTGVDIVT